MKRFISTILAIVMAAALGVTTQASQNAQVAFSSLAESASLAITVNTEINDEFPAPAHGVEFVNTWVDADTSNFERLDRFAIRIRREDAIELRISASPGVTYPGYQVGDLTFTYGNQTLTITGIVLDI